MVENLGVSGQIDFGATALGLSRSKTNSSQKPLEQMLNLVKRHHVWQIPDSCAAACITIAMKTAGKEVAAQETIHEEIFDRDWDGTHPESISEYLNGHGAKAELLKGQTPESARQLLDKNKVLIILIRDDFPTKTNDVACGHYVILQDVDLDKKMATIIDPSNALRYYTKDGFVVTTKNGHKKAEKRPFYNISLKDLTDRWHDEVAPGVVGRGYTIAVDTASKSR